MSIVSDLATYLQTNDLGTVATDIFYSYRPGDVSNGVFVLDENGPAPDRYIPTKRPSFQIFIRAADFDTGRTKFDQVRDLLHRIQNTQIGSYFFFYIMAVSEGGHIGRNDAGQDEFSINFETLIR